MYNGQNGVNPKHLKGFWPIFILVIVSMVAGGIIFAFAYGNIQQDEINSINFWHPFNREKTTQKLPAKIVPAK